MWLRAYQRTYKGLPADLYGLIHGPARAWGEVSISMGGTFICEGETFISGGGNFILEVLYVRSGFSLQDECFFPKNGTA